MSAELEKPVAEKASVGAIHAPANGQATSALRSKRTRKWTILAALAIGSLVGFLMVECLVRLMGLDKPPIWAPDPVVGWRPIPGATRHFTDEGDGQININSLGFRDHERTLAKPAGTFRIMALGDSMTEAVQVNEDQTFCHVLEQKLNSDHQPVEVLNLGVSGFSPIQELLMLKQEGPKFHPDLILLNIFLDNDISGCHPKLNTTSDSPYATVDGDKLKFDFSRPESSYADYQREPIHLIRANSATYRWFRTMGQRRAGVDPKAISTRFMMYAVPAPPVWEEAWTIAEKVLLECAAEADRLGAKLVVVSLPCAQVVDTKCWDEIQDQQPAMKELKWDLEGPERRLKAFTEAHHMLLFQPLDQFRARLPDGSLFLGKVGHMNARGHKLTGELMAQFLNENQLAPQENNPAPNQTSAAAAAR